MVPCCLGSVRWQMSPWQQTPSRPERVNAVQLTAPSCVQGTEQTGNGSQQHPPINDRHMRLGKIDHAARVPGYPLEDGSLLLSSSSRTGDVASALGKGRAV